MKSVYSPSEHVIYNATFYEDYKRAGTWPADGIEISDEDAIRFNGSNEPTGKMLDYQNGSFCWVDRPAPELTKEQLIAIAEGKRESLIDQAMQSISVIQLKLQAGRKLTTAETEKLNNTLDYIDAVTATDTSTAPEVNWPELPAA
ncbi:tail fiber assembly protein (plasmid) [Enterobacter roggenkampii]|uniref:tail fiber assembly protein n=1 Tax=Enterobacter roggenkampii TaxID=1812935 RepID=UPI0015FACE8F|nr:tail fiber assembly protein [Enterobacter roggenkampii]MBA7745197.1 tail fiber assembly protein [Enterobacter roggenkampii]